MSNCKVICVYSVLLVQFKNFHVFLYNKYIFEQRPKLGLTLPPASVKKEISMNRNADPFDTLPFKNRQCSPTGFVPKIKVNEFCLIYHLSYPEGSYINDLIPDDL